MILVSKEVAINRIQINFLFHIYFKIIFYKKKHVNVYQSLFFKNKL